MLSNMVPFELTDRHNDLPIVSFEQKHICAFEETNRHILSVVGFEQRYALLSRKTDRQTSICGLQDFEQSPSQDI